MDNKKYGVELDVDISQFTKKLDKAKELANKTKKSIEEPLRKVKISRDGKEEQIKIGTDTSNVKKQLKETADEFEKRMANIKPKIYRHDLPEVDKVEPGTDVFGNKNGYKINPADLKHYGYEINLNDLKKDVEEIPPKVEETKEKVKDLGDETENTEKKAQGITTIFARFSNDIPNSIEKGIKSIKRFSLSLLGIHSIWTALSRAVHSYMALDDSMSKRMQANWIAIGAIFAPIVEKIIKGLQKLVAYINIFVKAFTGGKVDLLSKAMKMVEKNTKGTTKAVKALNKELGTLDEIENLNFDQSGGDIDAGGFDINDALNEIKDIELNPKIVEFVENLGKTFKEIWDNYIYPFFKWLGEKFNDIAKWLDDMGIGLDDVILVAGGLYGAFKFSQILKGLGELIGVEGGSTGIFGLKTAFLLVSAFIVGDFIKGIYEAKHEINKMKESGVSLGDTEINGMTKTMERIKEINRLRDLGLEKDEKGRDLTVRLAEEIENAKDWYFNFNKNIEDGVEYTEEQKQEMWNLKKAIEDITKENWNTNIDVRITPVVNERGWGDFANNVVDIIDSYLPDFLKSGRSSRKSSITHGTGGGAGRGFAKGNVAYEPTMAQFGEYAGARSNPEITAPQNMMRETLFEALTDALPMIGGAGGGDTILYVNGRELARATYQDYQAEGNRLGNSNVAVRRVS